MALVRYFSIEQAKDAATGQLDPTAALERMLELVSLLPANTPPLFEPGIYRFRSLDEANEAREIATATRMRFLRVARSKGFSG